MPGVLKIPEDNHRDLDRSEVLVGLRSRNMSAEDLKRLKEETQSNGVTHLNGYSAIEDPPVKELSVETAELQSSAVPGVGLHAGQLPPEIEHITFGYLPLSRIITRLAQETFNGLTGLINEMADLLVSHPNQNAAFNHFDSHVNGNGIDHRSEANVRKKQLLFEFARDRRAQFIKLLVLLEWSRQAEAISKVIDIKVWLDGQRKIYDDATLWMGELKRLLGPLKMSNPDLKTALAALSLGKAPWLPDLGYIPPKPLSPQEMLRALQHINTLLSIRLNLHEKIPQSFRDFSITSGRATFRVRDEFEVELSIADEDPLSQLYFVDFRFTFSPTSAEIPNGRLRDEIEGRTNDALKREGLGGCYEFLHDLVLTHKLNILKHQAYDMARGLWSHHLKVEEVHRSLVVQYWPNRPGGKNWIEIGVKRRHEKKPSDRLINQKSAHIALRWFRSGKEVTPAKPNLGLDDLSLHRILNQVIAMHTNFIFDQVAAKLRLGHIYSNRLLKLRHVPSVTEPLDATLFIQLTTLKAVKMIQEPVTGRFALLPSSSLYCRAELGLNNLQDPAAEASSQLASLRSIVSQDEVEMRALSAGWEVIKSLNPGQETMRRLFPRETLRIAFFRRKSWRQAWILAFTSSLMRDSWWIVELGERRAEVEPGALVGNPIPRMGPNFKGAYMVPMRGFKSLVNEPSYAMLAHVEHIAAGMISQYIDIRELKDRKIPHVLLPSSAGSPGTSSAVLHLHLTRAPSPELPGPFIRTPPVWVNDTIALIFQGIDPTTHHAIHTVRACLRNPIPNITSLTANMDNSIAFHPSSGSFTFRLLTAVGELSIPLLLHRLSSIERLIQFLAIIKGHNLSCKAVSLNHIEFVYPFNQSALKATVRFPLDSPLQISLDKGNPHIRIQDTLNTHLRSAHGLAQVIRLLGCTLSLLRTFSAVETTHMSDDVHILVRSAIWYELRYQSPRGRFDFKLKRKGDDPLWLVRDLLKSGDTTVEVEQGLKIIKGASGEGWRGLNGGIVASLLGVEDLVRKIDEIYRAAAGGPNQVTAPHGPTGTKRKAEEEVVILD